MHPRIFLIPLCLILALLVDVCVATAPSTSASAADVEGGAWAGQVDGWSPLGIGTDGQVLALALDRSGALYAGGRFRNAGGNEVRLVARWDGADWHPLDSGITDGLYVNALAVAPGGDLYVGGRFRQAGGVDANHVARWDGERWSALGDGVRLGGITGEFASVNQMVVDAEGRLYVGGHFIQAGGLPALNVAMWDGEAWRPLGEGLRFEGVDYIVSALAIDSQGVLYAGGVGATPAAVAVVARWNGEEWTILGEPMPGVAGTSDRMIGDLVVDANDVLYLGGMLEPFSVGFWDGVQWRAVGSRFLAGANDLAFDAVGNLYASGHSGISQGDPFAGVAIWDGEQWHDLAEGLLDSSGLSSGGPMLLDEDGNLYLGGSFSEAGGFPANNIAMWSGMPVRSEPPQDEWSSRTFASIHPNPSHGTTWFSLRLATAQNVTVRVYDALGRQVDHLYEGLLPAGLHGWPWDRGRLSPGLYFIRAAGAGTGVVARVVVLE